MIFMLQVLVLTFCFSMYHVHAADAAHGFVIPIHERVTLPPLEQPLPPYPWSRETTERFVAHHDSSCCSDSPVLPIPAGMPWSIPCCAFTTMAQVQNNRIGLRGYYQAMALGGCILCVGSTATLATSGCCAVPPTVMSLAVCGLVPSALVTACSFLVGGVPGGNTNNIAQHFDRDMVRATIGFFGQQAGQMQEMQHALDAGD